MKPSPQPAGHCLNPQELQAMILLSVARTRALRDLSIIFWRHQGLKAHETDSLEVVLDRMEMEYQEILLAGCADVDHNTASEMKRFVDKIFEKKPSA
jgi:hypothetical protein